MAQEHRTVVNGRIVRYVESGLGRPVILLHAFPVNADVWRPVMTRGPKGWRFIAPDFRGFGGSSIDSAAVGMAAYANDVQKLMDALLIEEAVLGGLSMGGYVAFALMRQASARFSALMLADTRPTADTEEGLRARRSLLELVRQKGLPALAGEMLPKLLGETSRRERPDVVAEVRREIDSNSQMGVEAAIYALMKRPDSTPDLPLISCPTLVIVGADDTVTPLRDAEAMGASIRSSELAVIPKAGHLSALEAPEEFSTTITRWLGSLP